MANINKMSKNPEQFNFGKPKGIENTERFESKEGLPEKFDALIS